VKIKSPNDNQVDCVAVKLAPCSLLEITSLDIWIFHKNCAECWELSQLVCAGSNGTHWPLTTDQPGWFAPVVVGASGWNWLLFSPDYFLRCLELQISVSRLVWA